MRVVGYVRISKDANGNGHSLEAQKTAIEAHCQSKGWELLRVEQDIQSGGSTKKRDGLERALKSLDNGEADYLCVTKLDRLSRSVSDFNAILQKYPQKLVILDLEIDLTSPFGEMVATVVSAMARLERRLISERTKAGLAQAKADGVKLGNPQFVRVSADVHERIKGLRDEGASYRSIADTLTSEGVPTAQGASTWSAETVRKIALRSG